MSQATNKRRILRWTVLTVLAAPALLFCGSLLGLLPWSPIHCTHHDVDIHSGRVRLTRHLFWVRVHESIEDSALTMALRPEDFSATAPEWHHSVTFSPGLRHSPHYTFHSAIAQIRQLESAWRLGDFTPTARHASAKRILQLWQQTGDDDGAKPYLLALEHLALADSRERRPIDEEDLP